MKGFWAGLFSRHGFKVVLGAVGLLLALMWIYIGFWQSLLILVLVGLGVLLGGALDRNGSFMETLRRLFGKEDNFDE